MLENENPFLAENPRTFLSLFEKGLYFHTEQGDSISNLEINTPSCLVYVEKKLNSPKGAQQITALLNFLKLPSESSHQLDVSQLDFDLWKEEGESDVLWFGYSDVGARNLPSRFELFPNQNGKKFLFIGDPEYLADRPEEKRKLLPILKNMFGIV